MNVLVPSSSSDVTQSDICFIIYCVLIICQTTLEFTNLFFRLSALVVTEINCVGEGRHLVV